MHLEGVFIISPEVVIGSRKRKLRYAVVCDHPKFADAMSQAAKLFAENNCGTMLPTIRKGAPLEFELRFDAPPQRESYAKQFVLLAAKLFIELRNTFGNWQVGEHLAQVIKDAGPKRTHRPLRVMKSRRKEP